MRVAATDNVASFMQTAGFARAMNDAPDSSRFLEFFYFDAGGGHRSAATALKQVIATRFPNWRVEMVNLQDLLQSVDPVYRLTKKKVRSQTIYNEIVKRGWTYGSLAMLRGLQRGIKMQAPQMEALLERHWTYSRPDLVVSLIPNFNRVMFNALKRVHPDVPYVTVMTDIADCPPHFWQEKQEQYIICGSDKAVEQARLKGYRPDQVFQVSGMVLKPDFYRDKTIDRRVHRERLGLDPDLPTALIMFGGNGSKEAKKIVEQLERLPFKMQSIVLCGNSKRLQKKLQGRPHCHAVGFTDKVPDWMLAADFYIGKPGPGSLSEALECGLPIITERNARTMPQERYNTKWVQELGVAVIVKSFRKTSKVVQELFKGQSLELFRQNVQRVNNRAVFEIPEIFDHIIAQNTALISRERPMTMPDLSPQIDRHPY